MKLLSMMTAFAILASTTTARADDAKPFGPLVTMGIGGGALLTGLGMVALEPKRPFECPTNQPCNPFLVTDAQFNADQHTLTARHNLTTVGLTMAGIGAATMLGGVVWYLFTHKSEKPRALNAPWLFGSF